MGDLPKVEKVVSTTEIAVTSGFIECRTVFFSGNDFRFIFCSFPQIPVVRLRFHHHQSWLLDDDDRE